MPTTVYIIRHGATISADEKRYAGRLDVPLSPEGERQMERLAGHLSRKISAIRLKNGEAPFLDAVYSSDLQRSLKSAQIIALPFGLQPVVVPAFRERDFGRWEGMTFAEISRKFPDDFKSWTGSPLTFAPVGGESTAAVRERVLPPFYDIIGKKKGKKIAIVAHGGINRIIICELLGIPLQNIFRIEQDYSALNEFRFHGEFPVLRRMNYMIETKENNGHVGNI